MKVLSKKIIATANAQPPTQLIAGVYDMNSPYKKSASFMLSALMTFLLCISLPVANASDIDIYQQAKQGDVTLMLMLDISGSMGSGSIATDYSLSSSCSKQSDTAEGGYTRTYCSVSKTSASVLVQDQCTLVGTSYRCYDRMARLKDGVYDLLNGNTTKGITRVSDDKVMGLSTLGALYNGSAKNTGAILVPARRLDTQVTSSQTQRDILLAKVKTFSASTNTPTAQSYAETASYLMGTQTQTIIVEKEDYIYANNRYYICNGWDSNYKCSSYNGSINQAPSGYTVKNCVGSYSGYSCLVKNASVSNSYSGMPYSSSDTISGSNYIMPATLQALKNNTEGQQCSGQGIYVLTDGEPNSSSNAIAQSIMTASLSSQGNSFDCSNPLFSGDSDTGWACVANYSQLLVDKSKNPAGLSLKTAVVGFGKEFNGIESYSKNLTQQQNIANIDATTATTDIKNAARWGVYGGGGWYAGSSSDDVVSSVNNFINNLNTDIPAVTTGSPTIPVDSLNTIALQPWAYFPQFQPTPDKTYQVWFGNVKKYKNLNGVLKDRNNINVMSSKGEIVKGTIDYWAPTLTANSTDTEKDIAKIGGALMKLPLRYTTANVNGSTVVTQRNLLINRSITNTSTGASQESNNLVQVTKDYITDTATKADPDRGYLMNLLGYKVDATNPSTITAASLQKADELRQLGGVMHSSPILLNQKGRVIPKDGKIISTNRDDYVMFGSTQGLLHVVDAETGVEKFAFVPDEMVRNQKDAFLEKTVTNGGLSKMYYGIDGPWTAYTSYVPTGTEGYLTVGSGKYNASGKQWVYGGLRMGGRSYYAMDLSNIDAPKLKFHIDPDKSASGTPLSYMGQSWSKPTITWVNWKGTRKLVMFVGGGYDAGGVNGKGVNGIYQGYEDDNYNQISQIGAGVYMFDADNGDLLWWSGANVTSDTNTKTGVNAKKESNMKYSVVSRITIVDRNSDGLTDHLYFGDLGGQVWRIDLDNSLSSSSTQPFAKNVIRILNLNLANGKSPRFYESPVFTTYNEAGIGRFGLINVGSGNRSKPLAEYTSDESVTGRYFDAVYAIYDKDVTRNDLYELTSFITKDKTRNNLQEVTDRSTKVAYTSADGWYYKLKKGNKLQSEKVIGDLIAINYNLYVGIFDGSKPGLSGDCGAGVKGESFVERFCLPYSNCSTNPTSTDASADGNRISQGAGIIPPTLGGGCKDDECKNGEGSNTRQILTNTTSCQGQSCPLPPPVLLPNTPQQRLVPLRWYEEYANPTKVGN